MIKAIIFDFDGTIVDTFQLVLREANLIVKAKGHNQLEDSRELRSKSLRESLKRELGVNFVRLSYYVKELKKAVNKNINEIKVFPKIKPMLKEISKKYRVIILTSNSKEIVSRVIKREEIKIDLLYSNVSLFGKAQSIKELLKKEGYKKEEVIYVGDEIRDILACKKVDIPIIAVTWGYNSKKSLKENNPNHIVNSPNEIIKILNMFK